MKLGGADVHKGMVMFYSGSANINPGDNVVPMGPIPLLNMPLTQQLKLSFGSPYLKRDLPNPPAACQSVVVAPTPPPAAPVAVGNFYSFSSFAMPASPSSELKGVAGDTFVKENTSISTSTLKRLKDN